MTVFNLRTVRLRSGERYRDVVSVALEPLELGGQRFLPIPENPEASFAISQVSSGTLFELSLEVRLHGRCFRCLEDAALDVRIDAKEYQATSPGEAEELTCPYVVDDRLDLSAWARDAVALALPEKILCKSDCAGLCAGCGANLNGEPCACGPEEPDVRWSKLAELRDRLTS